MSEFPNRRRFLKTLGLGALSVPVNPAAVALPVDRATPLGMDRDAAGVIAHYFLERHPEFRDPASLLEVLPDLADESSLRDRIRADFASWQIEQIEGWQISRTEAVLCSAIALNLC